MVKTKRETIEKFVLEILPRFDAYLIQVQTRGERGETVVQVLADTAAGITIDECARISRELAHAIDEEGLFTDRYRLEVSSPGLDKPLRVLRQYEKNIGRLFRVRTVSSPDQQHQTMTLTAVDGAVLRFQLEDGSLRDIEFDDIADCRHQLPW